MGSGVQGSRAGHVVRVRRDLLTSCMTCPLCNKLLRDATTVSECLHTFCRKCILKKFTDEELESCPICHIDLGVVPAEKLRPDHNLQEVRNKIFPFKTLNPKPPLSLPVRRKERSLSSLTEPSRRVLTGRRSKGSRRFGKGGGGNDDFAPGGKRSKEKEGEKERGKKEKLQNNLDPETSSKEKPTNGGETELWKPLNCLLEAATRTKTLKPQIKEEEQQTQLISPKINTTNNNSNNNNDTNDVNTPSSTATKPTKLPLNSKEEKSNLGSKEEGDLVAGPSNLLGRGRKVIRRKNKGARSAEKLFGVVSNTRDRRIGPVWFSLVATANREGGGQLPQLSSSYLRIKDGDLTVLSIQKYITQKLNLTSEEEVEIVCRGQPVGPAMTLHGLVDLWLRSETSSRTHTMVGTPAKDFIMVLAYRRKNPVPAVPTGLPLAVS